MTSPLVVWFIPAEGTTVFRRANFRQSASVFFGASLLSVALVAAGGSALAQPPDAPVTPIPVPVEPELVPLPDTPELDGIPLPDNENAPEAPPPEQTEVRMHVTETDRDVRANDLARGAPSTCLNDRWNTCFNAEGGVDIVNLETGVIYGEWDFDIQVTMRTGVNSNNVTMVFWFGNTTARSVTPGTIRFFLNAGQTGGLRTKQTPEIVTPLNIAAEGTYQRTITPDLASTYSQGNFLSLSYYATIDNRASDLGYAIDESRVVRCDNQSLVNNGTGCIVSSHTPTVNWDRTNAPAINENIRTAIAAGHPSSLTRTNSTQAGINRSAACSPSRIAALLGPRPAGAECDEYPFASSVQGGASSQIKWVPGEENGFQSRWLGSFYQVNRIMENDPFNVVAE